MVPAIASFRRLVTGHDEAGQGMIAFDGLPPHSVLVGGPGGPTFFEVWSTGQSPAVIHRSFREPVESELLLGPPKGGTRLRVIEFPPEGEAVRNLTEARARESFRSMGGEESVRSDSSMRHPLMHRTETVDYGIVISGEITMILDETEVTLRAGDIVVQQGTSHAWANRSGENCRIAFVLIDGTFADGLGGA